MVGREKGGLGQVAAVNTLSRPWCGIRRCFFYIRVGLGREGHKRIESYVGGFANMTSKKVEQHVVATCWYIKWAKVGLFCEKKEPQERFSVNWP